MKTNYITTLLSIVLLSILAFSCSKDEPNEPNNITQSEEFQREYNLGKKIQSSLFDSKFYNDELNSSMATSGKSRILSFKQKKTIPKLSVYPYGEIWSLKALNKGIKLIFNSTLKAESLMASGILM